MLNGSALDNLVRSTLNDQMTDEVPAASVRDSLLAEAARVRTRSSVGPAVPPLVRSLREADAQAQSWSAQRPAFLEHDIAEKWLMMIVPVYAVR
jgi:hypothetical protein